MCIRDSDCNEPDNVNEPACSEDFDPAQSSLFAGNPGDEAYEYEAFDPENVDEICDSNPQDPICFAPVPGGSGPNEAFGPGGGEPPGEGEPPGSGFWGNQEQAEAFQDQQDNYSQFVDTYCEENPDDISCTQGVPPPPMQDGIIGGEDCEDNPYAPGCPMSGGQEGSGPPPMGDEGGAPPDSEQYCADNPDDPYCQNSPGDMPPGGEGQGPGGVDCSDPAFMDAPECGGGGDMPPGGEGDMPPGGVDCLSLIHI